MSFFRCFLLEPSGLIPTSPIILLLKLIPFMIENKVLLPVGNEIPMTQERNLQHTLL